MFDFKILKRYFLWLEKFYIHSIENCEKIFTLNPFHDVIVILILFLSFLSPEKKKGKSRKKRTAVEGKRNNLISFIIIS